MSYFPLELLEEIGYYLNMRTFKRYCEILRDVGEDDHYVRYWKRKYYDTIIDVIREGDLDYFKEHFSVERVLLDCYDTYIFSWDRQEIDIYKGLCEKQNLTSGERDTKQSIEISCENELVNQLCTTTVKHDSYQIFEYLLDTYQNFNNRIDMINFVKHILYEINDSKKFIDIFCDKREDSVVSNIFDLLPLAIKQDDLYFLTTLIKYKYKSGETQVDKSLLYTHLASIALLSPHCFEYIIQQKEYHGQVLVNRGRAVTTILRDPQPETEHIVKRLYYDRISLSQVKIALKYVKPEVIFPNPLSITLSYRSIKYLSILIDYPGFFFCKLFAYRLHIISYCSLYIALKIYNICPIIPCTYLYLTIYGGFNFSIAAILTTTIFGKLYSLIRNIMNNIVTPLLIITLYVLISVGFVFYITGLLTLSKIRSWIDPFLLSIYSFYRAIWNFLRPLVRKKAYLPA